MSTRAVILDELREGLRTTSQLMDATGTSRNAVLCALAGLSDGGYSIANVTAGELQPGNDRLFTLAPVHGGHREGRWRLVYDPEHPSVRTCSMPGCSIRLSRTNPGPYCRGHKAAVARLFMTRLCALLETEEVTAKHEQLALVR